MIEITQVKNFEGHELHCHSCGRMIKKAFRVGTDNKLFGSECVLKIAGVNAGKKAITIAAGRMSRLETLRNHCQKQFAEMVAEFGVGVEEMILCGKI